MKKIFSMTGEEGQVGAVILLCFQLALQIGIWLATKKYVKEWENAYLFLEQRDQRLAHEPRPASKIWGAAWSPLPPRIDYGAYTQHTKDAEAVCFFLESDPSLDIGRDSRCD